MEDQVRFKLIKKNLEFIESEYAFNEYLFSLAKQTLEKISELDPDISNIDEMQKRYKEVITLADDAFFALGTDVSESMDFEKKLHYRLWGYSKQTNEVI